MMPAGAAALLAPLHGRSGASPTSEPAITVRLDRPERIYRAGEAVAGTVVITTSQREMAISAADLTVTGTAMASLNAQTIGLFEALYNDKEPHTFFERSLALAGPCVVTGGSKTMPFSFDLVPGSGLAEDERQPQTGSTDAMCAATNSLPGTYHGAYASVKYVVSASVLRGLFSAALKASVEVLVLAEAPPAAAPSPTKSGPVPFAITSDSLLAVSDDLPTGMVPDFRLSGALDRVEWGVEDRAVYGHVAVTASSVAVASIEVQLVRSESVEVADGVTRERTLVSQVQLVDGDPCRNMAVPIVCPIPSFLTCPSGRHEVFAVAFQLDLVAVFCNDTMVRESFPLHFVRGQRQSDERPQQELE